MVANLKKIAGLLMVAVMVTTCAISGTLAKYTTLVTASDRARVAQFNVGMGDGERTFELFETILDSDGVTVETDVWNNKDDGAAVIAPGTCGEFDIVVYNDSEVTVDYKLDFTVLNLSLIPIQFSIDGGSTWTSSLSNLTGEMAFGQDTDTRTIKWRWRFDRGLAGNVQDTALGTLAASRDLFVTVGVVATFTQVD